MIELTEDPYVVIVARDSNSIIYRDIISNERWIIRGKCNQCGLCEVGAVNNNIVWTGIKIGHAKACYDSNYKNRKDNPVRPKVSEIEECTLSGEYL